MVRRVTCIVPSLRECGKNRVMSILSLFEKVYPQVLIDRTVKTTDMQKEKRGVVSEKA